MVVRPEPPLGLSLRLLDKLTQRLFGDEPHQTEAQAFQRALLDPQPFAPTIVWMQEPPPDAEEFVTLDPLPWQPLWVSRLTAPAKPGQHPRHDRGDYYCLDTSSVFAAAVLRHPELLATSTPTTLLDLCAAPGGKTMLAWRSLNPDTLICNETIGKRLGMLTSNLRRCGLMDSGRVRVLNLDPAEVARQFPQQMGVTIVDAPCSGQSLWAKGGKAPGCFHPAQIKQNANRQKRILAEASQTVRSGGYLAYMTCTYSPEENEKVLDWFLKRFPEFKTIAVPLLQDYQSNLTDLPCYRLFPHSGLGAGAFTVLCQRQ